MSEQLEMEPSKDSAPVPIQTRKIIDAYQTPELAYEALFEYAKMLKKMELTENFRVSVKQISDGGYGIYLHSFGVSHVPPF